jgi:ribosomal protein S18 acetylase RimI-like enzyme
MNTGITYRNCTPADVPAVLRFWKEAGTVPTSTDTAEALRTRLRRDPQLFVLAICGERLVGSLLGGWDGWRGNLYRLAVLPEFRLRGIAAHLVKTVEQRLAALGAVRVYALAVKPEVEPAATAFWETVGYEINPRVVPYVQTLG